MELTSELISACRKAAMSCRKCISYSSQVGPLEIDHRESLQQCEDICFAFLHAASSNSPYLQKLIFLCIGLCEECAEHAEEKKENVFMETAFHCRNFSNMLINFIPSEEGSIPVKR